ncbi:hypothetical protein TGAMA5MH_00890 [Trichoderma gamsii]|uniref:Uncharacterized protein n=1 Tax=Trichoderma gamsii TaxID=398673 RepID=A0A2K0TQM7_9HYPO|nr:hypothetical protein TGAMA5MH_00890 [Trichoderma gamsii]
MTGVNHSTGRSSAPNAAGKNHLSPRRGLCLITTLQKASHRGLEAIGAKYGDSLGAVGDPRISTQSRRLESTKRNPNSMNTSPVGIGIGTNAIQVGTNRGGQYFAGSRLWGVSSFISITFLSDEGGAWPPCQRKKQIQPSQVSIDNGFKLPDRSTVEAYFSVFPDHSRDSNRAKACVFSFSAITILLGEKLESFLVIESDQ